MLDIYFIEDKKMSLPRYSLGLFVTPLIVAITSQKCEAFSITPVGGGAFQSYVPEVKYDSERGKVFLDPLNVTEVKLGGTDAFLSVLKSSFKSKGWNFISSDKALAGSFNIQSYTANYSPLRPYNTQDVVWSDLLLTYSPSASGDILPNQVNPTPQNNNLHWIQWIVSNHGGKQYRNNQVVDLGHGNGDNNIDIFADADSPFYDESSDLATEYTFYDSPLRADIKENHNWAAELYLVEETGPKTVTIYNGIKWGWKNTYTPPKTSKNFSGTLASGYQEDRYKLDGLTPGSKYRAWTNNDLPSNRCNPNTFLSTRNDSGFRLGFDDDSSPVGDGFASALTGTVGSSGNINLNVRPAIGGARGQDRGNYELFVDVYDPQDSPDFSVPSSGGGGFGKERRGLTQQNPILPNSIQNGWQVFNQVPGCRWYDPPTTYGFEFQSLEDTLFTEILDFPAGDDQEFTVSVGDSILGNFSPGDKLDFVSLLGYPVDNFRITGIDSLFGPTAETAFPIQLAFQEPKGSFKMREISKPIDAEPVPEPGSILAANGMVLWFAAMRRILRKHKQV
jgi:hypothetical protein